MKPAAGHDGHGAAAGAMSVRLRRLRTRLETVSRSGTRSAGVRVLSDERGGHRRWSDCRLPQPVRGGSSRHPRHAVRERQVDRAGRRPRRRLEDCRMSGQRPDAERAGPGRRSSPGSPGRTSRVARSCAFSKDAGRTFGAPIRLDESGTLGRVDVELMPDGAAVASWIESAGGRAQFVASRVEPSGAKSPPLTVSGLAGTRASGYPRVAWHGDELVFAWIESRGRALVGPDRGGAHQIADGRTAPFFASTQRLPAGENPARHLNLTRSLLHDRGSSAENNERRRWHCWCIDGVSGLRSLGLWSATRWRSVMSFIRSTARMLAGAALVGLAAAPIVATAEEPKPQQRGEVRGRGRLPDVLRRLPWRVSQR